MPRSRVVGVTGRTLPKSRVLRVTGTGTVPETPNSRVVRVTGTGLLSVAVNPVAGATGLEPTIVVTLNPTLVGGGTADSWTVRVVSGLPVGVIGSEPPFTFAAPSHINGGTSVLGFRATKEGVTSPEVTATFTVLPQNEWWWTGAALTPAFEAWLTAGFSPYPSDPPEYGAGEYGTGTYGR